MPSECQAIWNQISRAWSESKLFAKVSSRQQQSSLVCKELILYIIWKGEGVLCQVKKIYKIKTKITYNKKKSY